MDEYYHNSLSRESEQMDRIRATVRDAGIFVVLGYSERDRGSLYISQVRATAFLSPLRQTCHGCIIDVMQSFIDPTGTIVHHRRKIKPTHVERAFWGEGQAESLKAVVPSPFGNIGGLNCWEHTQPLLRYYEYTHDVDIHVGSWPLAWDMPPPEKMPWTYQLTPQMCMTLPQVLALEGACFVLVCSQVLTEKNRERCRLRGFDYATTPGGGFSMIFGPDGSPLVERPPSGEEVILYADVNLALKAAAKHTLDIVGHYSRPDLLSLSVTTQGGQNVQFSP